MRLRVCGSWLLAAALAAAPGTLAQEITGTITGTVADQTGGVLPGVTVTVRNTGTGLTRELQTGAEGGYNVPLLPVGRYEVTFVLAGFQTTAAQNIQLHVNGAGARPDVVC
jgi:carboxypeptidase family protein